MMACQEGLVLKDIVRDNAVLFVFVALLADYTDIYCG